LADRPLLRRRPVLALLAAEVVSTTGSQMTWLALPWFVLLTTGSATRMTLVVAAELIGIGLLGLPGGKLLGRIGAWRTMLLCDGLRGPLMLLVPVLHWSGHLSFGALMAVAFGLGALSAPYFAAQRVIVPELLGEDEVQVSRASALFQGATRVTMLLGPVVGGVLISVMSAPAVLVVDAATYFVAVALVGLLVPRPRPLADEGEGRRGIRDGFRFLVREPLLRVWTPIFAVGDAAWNAFFVSVPVLVVTRFDADPRVAGWLLASFGVGAVLGNVVAFRCGCSRPTCPPRRTAPRSACRGSRTAWSTRASTRS
jgi:MFS family permease